LRNQSQLESPAAATTKTQYIPNSRPSSVPFVENK
jgi:hypothetical protein